VQVVGPIVHRTDKNKDAVPGASRRARELIGWERFAWAGGNTSRTPNRLFWVELLTFNFRPAFRLVLCSADIDVS